jgi:hypothetical protein
MKKKYLQLQQEKVHAEAELEGVHKSDVKEQQLKQQVCSSACPLPGAGAQ